MTRTDATARPEQPAPASPTHAHAHPHAHPLAHGLSETQVEHYRREGYLVAERIFDADDLARVDAAIQDLTAKALAMDDPRQILEFEPENIDGKRIPRRIYNPFDAHDAFRRLATDARLLDGVETLIGPNIAIQHSKLNMKPARVGSVVEWHQDLAYFPHTNDDVVTALVYLDDASVDNGCLQVLPRHHTHYFSHDAVDGTFAGMITEDLGGNRFGRPVPLEAPAGSAIFMHGITPHSSLPNRSSRSRRTLIFEFRATDSFAIYFGQQTLLNESKTHLLRGKFARYARFGGPAPLIPNIPGTVQSLYQLQADTKAKNNLPSLG